MLLMAKPPGSKWMRGLSPPLLAALEPQPDQPLARRPLRHAPTWDPRWQPPATPPALPLSLEPYRDPSARRPYDCRYPCCPPRCAPRKCDVLILTPDTRHVIRSWIN